MRNIVLVTIIVLTLVLGAAVLTRGHQWGDDFASYIMQAESIWHGNPREFVQHNSFTIFESSSQIGPVAYPWGYPLILTSAYAWKGIHPLALKIPAVLFYAGFLVCLYLLMTTRLTDTESLLVVALFAFNPVMLGFLDQILSDIPFLFFSTLALYLMLRPGDDLKQRLLLGVVLFLASFIRTQGILLLASFVTVHLWGAVRSEDREWRRAVWRDIAIVCAAFAVLFVMNLLLFPQGETSHLARFEEFSGATAIRFAGLYFDLFGSFFGEGHGWRIIYYVVFTLFMIGAWIRRKQDSLFIVFFVLWMSLVILWPSWQGIRFIFPLLPIFIYFSFQGVNFFFDKLAPQPAQWAQRLAYGFWALTSVIFLVTSGTNAYVNLQNGRAINGPFDPVSREVYEYIQEETPPESVIVFFKPRAMRLMTGRDSIMITECDRMGKGDYLVLSKKVGRNQQIPPEEINTCQLPLTAVLTNSRFIVYQIQK